MKIHLLLFGLLADNTVPVLLLNSTIEGTVGETVTFNLQGYDPDPGDVLTYHVLDDVDGTVQVDAQTGDVTIKLDPSKQAGLG